MLNSITIKNFKAIQDQPLELKELASVNYLVGENGCGKSSVLETVHGLSLYKYNREYCFQVPNILSGDALRISLKYQDNFGLISVPEYPYDKLTKIVWKNKNCIKDQIYECLFNKKTRTQSRNEVYDIDKVSLLYCYHKDRDYLDERICITTDWLELSIFDNKPPYYTKYPEIRTPDNLHTKDISEFRLFYYGDKNIGEFVSYEENLVINNELEKIAPSKKFSGHTDNHNCGGYNAIGDFYRLILNCIKISTIICIEEPETNLHPKWQKLIPSILQYFSKNNPNCQFIISTHSNYIISEALKLDNQKVYHIENGTCAKPEGISKATFELNDFDNINDSLGVKSSDLLFANGVIWVEGPTDILYIRKWIQLYYLANPTKTEFKEGLDYTFSVLATAIWGYTTLEDYEKKDYWSDVDKIVNLASISRKNLFVIDRDTDLKWENGELKACNNKIHKGGKNKLKLIDNTKSTNFETNPESNNTFWINIGTLETYLKPSNKKKKTFRIDKEIIQLEQKKGRDYFTLKSDKSKTAKLIFSSSKLTLDDFHTDVKARMENLYNTIASWNKA